MRSSSLSGGEEIDEIEDNEQFEDWDSESQEWSPEWYPWSFVFDYIRKALKEEKDYD